MSEPPWVQGGARLTTDFQLAMPTSKSSTESHSEDPREPNDSFLLSKIGFKLVRPPQGTFIHSNTAVTMTSLYICLQANIHLEQTSAASHTAHKPLEDVQINLSHGVDQYAFVASLHMRYRKLPADWMIH